MKNTIEKIKRVFLALSRGEKFLMGLFSFIFIVSFVFLIAEVEESYTSIQPQKGGSFIEGIIGMPRFINPVIAETNADKDLTSLVYSGLMRINETGELDLDLAESYSVSEDGLIYSFKLKDNLSFHDGSKLKAEDIAYTIERIKDPLIKSPRRINWEGVEIEIINDREINFILSKPYGSFLYQTTVGILPSKLWKDVPTEDFKFYFLNNNPIGSGPYKMIGIKKAKVNELPSFELSAFKQFALGEPYINQIIIKSYKDNTSLLKAYKNKEIDSLIGITNKEARELQIEGIEVIEKPLPRTFAIFLNSGKNSIFSDKNIRKVISQVIDREEFISKYLYGFAISSNDPYPDGDVYEKETVDPEKLMISSGWTKNDNGKWEKKQKSGTLNASFSFSVADSPSELKDIAYFIADKLNNFGFEVLIEELTQTDLIQEKIRPRAFEALLFGMIINHESDLYAFWHSSQRLDPGLNVSGYANIKTDAILEKLRIESSAEEKKILLEQFNEIIEAETPAIFLFIPNEIYIPADFVKNVVIPSLSVSADRFSLIHKWHIKEKKKIDLNKLFINKS